MRISSKSTQADQTLQINNQASKPQNNPEMNRLVRDIIQVNNKLNQKIQTLKEKKVKPQEDNSMTLKRIFVISSLALAVYSFLTGTGIV